MKGRPALHERFTYEQMSYIMKLLSEGTYTEGGYTGLDYLAGEVNSHFGFKGKQRVGRKEMRSVIVHAREAELTLDDFTD